MQVNLGVWIYLQFFVNSYSLCYIYISSCYYEYDFDLIIISELTLFYLLMFLIILLLVYLDYMLNVATLELCLCIGSYSAYSLDQWVSGKYCVGMVPRPYLSTITIYSPKLEVDRGSYTPIESFVFLLRIIMIVEHHYYREVIAMFMIFLANITMHIYNLF